MSGYGFEPESYVRSLVVALVHSRQSRPILLP